MPPPTEQHPDEPGEGGGKGTNESDGNDPSAFGKGDKEEEGNDEDRPRSVPTEHEETPRGIDDGVIVAPPAASTLAEPGTGPSSRAPNDGPIAVANNSTAMAAATTTATTTSTDGRSREEILEERLRAVSAKNRVLTEENQDLQRKSNRKHRPSESLQSQLIIAVLAALGFAPPLFVDVDAVLRWKGRAASVCCRWNRSGDGGNPPSPPQQETLRRGEEEEKEEDGSESGGGGGGSSNNNADGDEPKSRMKRILHRIATNLRLPYYVFVSVIDVGDAVLDIIVPVQALLEDSDDYDDDGAFKRWALVMLFATILARLLGGVHGVVYHRIDKSDREVSYFLVEMTIYWIEDCASLIYVGMKSVKGVDVTSFESYNVLFTFACSLVFVIPTMCRYKNIGKRLRPCAAWILFGWCLLILALVVFVFGFEVSGLFDRLVPDERLEAYGIWIEANFGTVFAYTYAIFNAIQLYILFDWSRYLYRKDRSGTTQPRLSDRSVPAGWGDDLAP